MTVQGISLQRELQCLRNIDRNDKGQERLKEICAIIEKKMERNKLAIGEGCLTEDICYNALDRHFHKWVDGQILVDFVSDSLYHGGGEYELGNLKFVCNRYGNNIMEVIVDCEYEYCGNGCPYCGGDDFEVSPQQLVYAFNKVYAKINTYYSVKTFLNDFYDFITDWDFRYETIKVIADTYFNPSDYY